MIANARMYAVNDVVAAAWSRVFEWVADRAGAALDVIAHPAPRPLAELWQRDDLGSAPMCGYPWITWKDATTRPLPVAAPVPSPSDFNDRPIYWTDIVVAAESRIRTIDDLRGARFAYTIEDSQSGYQAPRRFFAERAHDGAFFGDVVGPLVTPRRVVDAIIANDADAGPLDAWWHALLRRHELERAKKLRVIARTPPTPIPLIVCAARTPAPIRDRMQDAFIAASDSKALADALDTLLLQRFTRPNSDDYRSLLDDARAADALGYHRLQ